VPVNKYKLSRKNAYVALANISDALNRMLAEPKSKQKNAAEYHELVVLNYMMSTHIATLAAFALSKTPPVPDPEYLPVVHAVMDNLDQAMNGLKPVAENIPSTIRIAGNSQEKIFQKKPMDTENSQAVNSGVENSEAGNSKVENSGVENSDRLINPTIDSKKADLEGSYALAGLTKLNNRVEEMVSLRKKELEQGITETQLRLSVVKSVNDQFNFIWKISEDLLKTLKA
jgi:hypothetical protein